MASRIYNTVKKKVKDFANWILNHVPPVPEIVDRKLKEFKKKIYSLFPPFNPFVISALNNSLENYVIDGKE